MGLAKTLWTSIVDLVSTGQNVSDNLDVAFSNLDDAIDQVDVNTVDIVSIRAGETHTTVKMTPQETIPSHLEGQFYFSDEEKILAMQTDVADVHVHLGTDIVIRVINRTGSIIPPLTAIRNGGIDETSNELKAVAAQANILTTSFVIGITPKAIGVDEEGWIVANGKIHNVDTSLLSVGGTLFLSDVDTGGLIQTIPDVASALGTVLISNNTVGEIFVKIDNLITYPQATGYIRGQNTPLYSLTTTPQNVVDYIQEVDRILTVDALAGTITVPLNGLYQITFTAVSSFISSTVTRTVYFELYNETTATIEGAYPRSIPKSATEEGISFTAPFSAIAGHSYIIRVRADVTMDLTFDNAAFMMTSTFLG